MKLQVQKISSSEFDELEKQISDNDQTLDQMYEIWQSLDNAFYETDAEFRLTYFRLYVRLTWKILEVVGKDYFIEVVRRQAATALLLDVDVLNSIMWYLGFNNADKQKLVSLFLDLKKAFLQSEAVVGVWQGKNVTVAALVKEIDSVYGGGDSLAIADFESRLRQIMFPDEIANKYFTADPEEAKERFLDLVSFFETFTQENIWYVVDAFINPEKYQNVAPGETPAIAPVTQATTTPKPTPTAQPSAPTLAPAPKPAPANPPLPRPSGELTKPSALIKLTSQQIKSQIEKEFSTEDVEGIMGKLNELAEKNNDPKIAEMIYYDESSGKFLWKE